MVATTLSAAAAATTATGSEHAAPLPESVDPGPAGEAIGCFGDEP